MAIKATSSSLQITEPDVFKSHFVRTTELYSGRCEYAGLEVNIDPVDSKIAQVTATVLMKPSSFVTKLFQRNQIVEPWSDPIARHASYVIHPSKELEKVTQIFVTILLPYSLNYTILSSYGIAALCQTLFPHLDKNNSNVTLTDGNATKIIPRFLYPRILATTNATLEKA